MIDPQSVAVIGATETPGSFGARTLENIRIGYQGKIFPINPKYQSIAGLTCYADLESLPEVPDCVVVIVPMAHVEDLVQRAANMGVGGFIVYSAGFAEVGRPELVSTQYRLADIARKSGMRILGPNCVGIANFRSMIGLNFMPKFAATNFVKGSIGLISQSGALGYCVMQAMERGVGFSHYLSPGNSCDVDVCDLINYLVEDDGTKVIVCMFEGVRDGQRLLEAARRALKADKPLLIYKLANSAISQRTALSHTGTMAGTVAAYQAAFRKTGVVVIDSWEEALEAAVFFSKAGHPKADGIGVMASSGGAAVMAADKAEEFDVVLPAPTPATAARLAKVVPDFGSTANPCDLTAESLKSVQMYGECIRAFAEDPNFAAVVVPMMSAHKPNTVERAEYLSSLAGELTKPICLVWINEWLNGPGSEVYDASAHISMFRSMTRCLKTIRLWLDHYARRDRILRAEAVQQAPAGAQSVVRSLCAGRAGTVTLSESESKKVLSSQGIAVTREVLAKDPAAAIAAANAIGFPVALKVDSPFIPHKTEAGVIRLNLQTPESVGQAARELLDIANTLPGRPVINGILVQQMVPKGIEMMLGSKCDPQFGPMILCGFGGIDVELTKDIAVALAPVSPEEAREMVLSLNKSPLLTGYRNLPVVDLDALTMTVSRLSSLAVDCQDSIAETDINPFTVTPAGGVAVDALIVCVEQAAVDPHATGGNAK